MAIFQRGLEAPLFDGVNGPSVKAESQAANHTNVARISILVNDQREDAHSLSLGVAGLFRIFRKQFRRSRPKKLIWLAVCSPALRRRA